MRKLCAILLLVLAAFFSEAQRAGIPSYYYTRTSEYFLSDAEMDSLFYEGATRVLTRHQIPDEIAQKTYPSIRQMILYQSKKGVIQAFTDLEREQGIRRSIKKGTQQYDETKRLYSEAIQQQIESVFFSNKTLSKYLSLNDNDRITSFNSTVRIGIDGKLLVQEDIRVYNGNGQPNWVYQKEATAYSGEMNNEIKRGIVRTFPLYYINEYKLFQNTTFKLKGVWRDGEREPYHTEDQTNGIALYLGSSNLFLEPGYYHYRILYETDRQLKIQRDFDELYWNVTGNGWSFKIDSANCTIIFPAGTKVLSNKCYTGSPGSTAEECVINNQTVGDSLAIVFTSASALLPYQGLTVATSFQKGAVRGPDSAQKLRSYFWNNKAVFFLPLAALFSALFCFIFWLKFGRDPKKGVIYPQYDPPPGFSPAALGYIINQRFEKSQVVATLVDAAVRNKIKIVVERDGLIFKHNEYSIKKGDGPVKPASSHYEDFEKEVNKLMGTKIEKGHYNSSLNSLNTRIKNYFDSTYKNKDGTIKKTYKGFFALNNKYTTLPVLVCITAAIWGFFGGVVTAFIVENYWQIGYYVAGFILCVVVLRIFGSLLTAYSPEGRLLADRIEGFRMFLSAADEKRLDLMNPPQKSLELYEKYLPFAIALNCENAWGKKFEDIISSAYLDGSATSSFSQGFVHDNHNFSSGFAASFGGAISSASTPPSSSSGGGSSFGGGSSGGGGGGGGGGGW